MQQLRPATRGLPEACARELMMTIPGAMQLIREQMRTHRRQELTVPQFRTLIYCSLRPDPTLSALAEHIGISLPAASRMVDLLVRRGLMQRKADAKDRRRVLLGVTVQGRAAFRAAHHATIRAFAQRFRSLPAGDLRIVAGALQTLKTLLTLNGSTSGSDALDETEVDR